MRKRAVTGVRTSGERLHNEQFGGGARMSRLMSVSVNRLKKEKRGTGFQTD